MVDQNKEYVDHLLSVMEKLPIEDKTKVRLSKNTYLTKEHYSEPYVYILIQGVIILSFAGANGEKINLAYMNKPGILTLLREEDQRIVEQPYDIKVDSNTATFYQINRIKFWEIVNKDEILSQYVKIHYRQRISEHILRSKQNVGNNKTGQVCALLYRCVKLFGVKNETNGDIVINHKITHQTMGEFCGMRNRSAVTRIINQLVKENVIEQKSGLIVVRNIQYLEKYAN